MPRDPHLLRSTTGTTCRRIHHVQRGERIHASRGGRQRGLVFVCRRRGGRRTKVGEVIEFVKSGRGGGWWCGRVRDTSAGEEVCVLTCSCRTHRSRIASVLGNCMLCERLTERGSFSRQIGCDLVVFFVVCHVDTDVAVNMAQGLPPVRDNASVDDVMLPAIRRVMDGHAAIDCRSIAFVHSAEKLRKRRAVSMKLPSISIIQSRLSCRSVLPAAAKAPHLPKHKSSRLRHSKPVQHPPFTKPLGHQKHISVPHPGFPTRYRPSTRNSSSFPMDPRLLPTRRLPRRLFIDSRGTSRITRFGI